MAASRRKASRNPALGKMARARKTWTKADSKDAGWGEVRSM
eukprot:CAMPEP_0172700002 /NCGR_PEP_ID=MMETSP1074-20121228/30595_1 /TAXON_ID=2916 /ORGANISM="Ceratium fusus, Strain PA161109" /LENGTH=40 /DNA_ID= /DNA_START= /DNA_END= /DNA_ORIENTATION=